MRLAILVVAGLIGSLWFATREPDAPAAPPAARARRADLSSLQTQVAAAARAPRAAAAVDDSMTVAFADAIEPSIDDDSRGVDLSGLAVQLEAAAARDVDLDELRAQLEAAAARDVEDPTEAPADGEAVGHEVITVMGYAPIIDTGTVSHCGSIETDYILNIPTGRTFEIVLGAGTGSQGPDDGVVFSSGTQIENTYIVEEDNLVVEPGEAPEPDIIIED